MAKMRMSDGCALEYRFDGNEDKPVLMFSNSHGFTFEMWDPQIDAMTRHVRVLRYNNRGHGASDMPDGPCIIERVARDALELIEGLDLHPVSFCGLSIGGMVGIWLAANAPGVLSRVVLANTSAYLGEAPPLEHRMALIEKKGMDAAVPDIMPRSLSRKFQEKDPATTERMRAMVGGMSPAAYIAGGHAVLGMDLRASLGAIETPVLVIAGSSDTATPPAMGEAIARGIADARFALLDAAHLSNIEQADEFNRLIADFLCP